MNADARLRTWLRRIRRRWFALEWSWAMAKIAAGAACLVAAAALVARLLSLSGSRLLVLAAAATALGIVWALAVVWPLRRRPSDRQVARYVEERCPEFEDRLTSATALAEGGERSPFGELLIHDAAGRLDQLDLARVIDPSRLRQRGGALAAATAALVAAIVFAWPVTVRAWREASVRLFPARLSIEVAPGHARVVEGAAFEIKARLHGWPEGVARPIPVVRVAVGEAREVPMQPTEDGYTLRLPSVTTAFDYRVSTPRLVSDEYHVDVRRRPRVERIDLSYRYPKFTGLAQRDVPDAGDVYAPKGTEIRVRVHANVPVAEGVLGFTDGKPIALAPSEPKTLEGRFVVEQDGAYRIGLTNTDQVSNSDDTQYFVRVMDDRPPEVRIVRPAGDSRVTRLEEVAIEARADDDYGVDRLELVYAARGGPERIVDLHKAGSATSVTGGHTVFIEDLDVKPGDFVTFYARARDIARGKRATEAKSDIFFLEVRPFNEEFEAAQSQAMMAMGGGSFDDLAAQQKEIIVATWKIERRQGAGRSVDDIRAIARAQSEVKSRAERLAGRLTPPRTQGRPRPGGGQGQGAGPVPPPAGADPMRQAVEAMSRAQASLDALETTKALPHEMEALNALLRAQADVQRRQVSRQNAGGGRGTSGTQDLSALFDRELQRQQQTNYENQPQQAQSGEEKDSDALARLRELARRQDALSRQQQELARQQGQLAQEDAKRRLERLTREQERLQREADALARSLERQQRSQSGGSSASGSEGEGQAVREAAEQMRQATEELSRGDSKSAGARGAKAGEQLRSAERQMQGGLPDERRRASGDLELEARELAAEQRRVARSAAEGSRQGGESGERMQRLAGDEDRLADRTEQLARNARELAGQGGNGQQELARAARALETGQIDDRMRELARSMRDAGASGRTQGQAEGQRLAEAGQALAEALERAAGGLGAATGRDAESTKLADQLARTRGMRERMAELERQIERASRETTGGDQRTGAEQGSKDSRGQSSERQQAGQQQARGNQGAPSPGNADSQAAEGRRGEQGGRPGGNGNTLGELQQEYSRTLREVRELVDDVRGRDQNEAGRLSTPEAWEPSRSAPGTESFKQDFARWEELRRDVALTLERAEGAVAARLNAKTARDRLDAAPDDRLPDSYRRAVARYFESLAKQDRP